MIFLRLLGERVSVLASYSTVILAKIYDAQQKPGICDGNHNKNTAYDGASLILSLSYGSIVDCRLSDFHVLKEGAALITLLVAYVFFSCKFLFPTEFISSGTIILPE